MDEQGLPGNCLTMCQCNLSPLSFYQYTVPTEHRSNWPNQIVRTPLAQSAPDDRMKNMQIFIGKGNNLQNTAGRSVGFCCSFLYSLSDAFLSTDISVVDWSVSPH